MATRDEPKSQAIAWDRIFCVAAGVCDALTGVLLVIVPAETMGLLGILVLPTDAIHLRFLGVFVACVGVAYLYPWAFGAGHAREQRLSVVIELTTLIRLAVALFVGSAVALSMLDPAWLAVGAADVGIALGQLALRAKGHFRPVD